MVWWLDFLRSTLPLTVSQRLGTWSHQTYKKTQQAHLGGHCLLLGLNVIRSPCQIQTGHVWQTQNQTMTNLYLTLDWPSRSLVRSCRMKGTFLWGREMTVVASGRWVLPGGSWATWRRGRRLGYGGVCQAGCPKELWHHLPFISLQDNYMNKELWFQTAYNTDQFTKAFFECCYPKYLQDFSVGFQSVLAAFPSSPPSHRTHTHTSHLLWHLSLTEGPIC